MRVLSANEDDVVFWVRHAHGGVLLSFAAAAGALAYALTTWSEPYRPALVGLLGIALAVTATVPLLPLRRIMSHPRGMLFFYAWSTAICAVLGVAIVLDGGVSSPLALLLFLPLIYGAMAYPPPGVIALGTGVVVGFLAIGATHGSGRPGLVLLGAIALASVTAMCAYTARTHWAAFERQRTLARRLAELAHHDGLTGCLNHRAFHGRLAAEVERAVRHRRPVALLSIDLDDFKVVNDHRGHPAGDEVLRAVGGTLTRIGRISDVVARVGGDEFALLLPETSRDQARLVAERIRQEVREATGGSTVSIGLAIAPDDAFASAELLERADDAVYQAKHAGRDAVRVYGEHLPETGQRGLTGADLAVYRRLREILDAGAIDSVFQPVVDLVDGTVVGYEALARIRGSQLPPDRWLDLAEQVGLREQLELAMWRAHLSVGPPPAGTRLFLNASPQVLLSGALDASVSDLGQDVTVEVSGGQRVRDYALLTASLGSLLEHGAAVAIDDTHAAHATLLPGPELAPQFLKIDAALVADVQLHPRRLALVEAVQQLAERVGSQVIAEGVEHPDEAVALRAVGIAYAQGRMFAAPGPAWPEVAWSPAAVAEQPAG